MPSKELTTKTFESWMRRVPEMLGYVDLLLGWSVLTPVLCTELDRILKGTVLRDDNTGVIQVRAAEDMSIQVSALVSAVTPSNLVGLKFFARERPVRWIQANTPNTVLHGRNFVNPPDPLLKGTPAADVLLPAGRPGTLNSGRPSAIRVFDGRDQNRSTFRSTSPRGGPSGSRGKRRHGDLGPMGTRVFPAFPPVVRVPLANHGPTPQTASSPLTGTGYEASIFIGPAGAEKRGEDLVGPGGDVMREREEAARRKEGTQGPAGGDADGEGTQEGGEGPTTETHAGAKGEVGAKA